MSTTIEFILAEFGPDRGNNGDAKLPTHRLEPSISSFRKHFPEAKFTVYTDQDWESTDQYSVVNVDPPFDKSHPRYGNRCNDWAQPYGMLQSTADIAIGIDSDLLVVNPEVRTIIPLVMQFGMCIPVNGRHIVWRDAASDCDGGPVQDETHGMGTCLCTAFMAMQTYNDTSREMMLSYRDRVIHDAQHGYGARGPLSLWRAMWDTGIFPFVLPTHWCVTGSNLWLAEDYKGKPLPIILHAGHAATLDQYKRLLENS